MLDEGHIIVGSVGGDLEMLVMTRQMYSGEETGGCTCYENNPIE